MHGLPAGPAANRSTHRSTHVRRPEDALRPQRLCRGRSRAPVAARLPCAAGPAAPQPRCCTMHASTRVPRRMRCCCSVPGVGAARPRPARPRPARPRPARPRGCGSTLVLQSRPPTRMHLYSLNQQGLTPNVSWCKPELCLKTKKTIQNTKNITK